jgi:exonuclease SbcD
MPENSELLDQIAKLLKSSSRKSYEIAETNFKIGQLIFEACRDQGEDVISKIAATLNQKGIPVSVNFLFDTCRVFRSIRSESTLKDMKKRLNGNLKWGFLVHNCTKAPSGDTEEAALYWENKLNQIENALEEADRLHEMIDSLPVSIKEQVLGILRVTGHDSDSGYRREREILDGEYKIGHMADMQFDDSFTVAGRVVIDPQTGMNDRLIDIHSCTSFAVEKMVEAGCRACLIAGDATESHNPSPNVQKYLLASLTKLARHMSVFIEPGNHGLSKNPKDSTALEFLKGRENIFVVEEPAIFYQEGFTVNKTPSETWPQRDCAKIFILPFPSKAIINGEADGKSIEELNKIVSEKLRLYLHAFRSEVDPRVPNILMTHITVAGAKGAENQDMLKYDPKLYPDDLYGFDYVALGHIHEYQNIEKSIFYSGSIDRMDFNEEGQLKGFLIATFEGHDVRTEFIETPARTFQTLTPDFFLNPEWQSLIETKTIYRIKGEVTKEQYEALKPALKEFPLPLLNKLTVRREVRIRDEKMTEELKEEEAVQRYLTNQGIDEELLKECLSAHNLITSNSKGEVTKEDDTTLFKAGALCS